MEYFNKSKDSKNTVEVACTEVPASEIAAKEEKAKSVQLKSKCNNCMG